MSKIGTKIFSVAIIIFLTAMMINVSTTEASASILTADSLINHAKSHIGDKYNTFEDRQDFTTDWCSQFVQHCSAKSGLNKIIPTKGCAYVNDMAYDIVNNKNGKITFVNKTFYNNKKTNFKSKAVIFNQNYKPRKGDLIIFSSDGKQFWTHIGIVVQDNNNPLLNIKTIEGNVGTNYWKTSSVMYKTRSTAKNFNIVAYVTPRYDITSSTYTLKYSDGLSSTTNDSSVIAPTTMISGKSSPTTTKKFTRSGYYYDCWYIFRYIDGKANYWCRETKTGANGKWIPYDKIPYNYSKVKVLHGSNLTFTLPLNTVIYYTPVWKNHTVTAGNSISGKPQLTWEKVDGATKYEIYRSGYSNGTYTKMFTTTSTNYINTSAKEGYTYFYKVKAIRENESVISDVIKARCLFIEPEITKVANSRSGYPTLEWNKVPGAIRYEVYRSGYRNGTYTKMFTTTKTSYTNTSAKSGYTYYYKVKAIGSNSNRAESDVVAAKCK